MLNIAVMYLPSPDELAKSIAMQPKSHVHVRHIWPMPSNLGDLLRGFDRILVLGDTGVPWRWEYGSGKVFID